MATTSEATLHFPKYATGLTSSREGFNKFLLASKHFLAGMAEKASYHVALEMMTLTLGDKNHDGKNLVHLYESGFYSYSNVYLSGYIKNKMHKYYYARVIGSLW
jgi:hypothetical protein